MTKWFHLISDFVVGWINIYPTQQCHHVKSHLVGSRINIIPNTEYSLNQKHLATIRKMIPIFTWVQYVPHIARKWIFLLNFKVFCLFLTSQPIPNKDILCNDIDFYHLEYSNYFLDIYTHNVLADMSFGLLHMFHIELH